MSFYIGIRHLSKLRFLCLLFLALTLLTIIYIIVMTSTPMIMSLKRNHHLHSNLILDNASQHNNTMIMCSKEQVSVTLPLRKMHDIMLGISTKLISKPNGNICPNLGKDMQLIIVITSALAHFEARMAIRMTWGHYNSRQDVAIIFILGTTTNQTILQQVYNEANLYSDIITARFIDSYHNLTFKTLALLQWVANYCSKASFLLKTDDDMFINVPELLKFISMLNPEQRSIYGRVVKKWHPVRTNTSRYYVPSIQFEPSTFPDFTTGPAYLMPAHISNELYSASLNYNFLRLEDVFISGIVATDLEISLVSSSKFANKIVKLCQILDVISVHKVSSVSQFDFWRELNIGTITC